MCGISGMYSLNGVSDVTSARFVESSYQHNSFRGPDDRGIYHSGDGRVHLAHNRLSLVDLSSAGHQPMKKHSRVIVFNGEVYNFKGIRAELIREGYTFRSHSDMEVLLSAYDKWGIDALKKVNGPLAFALYDEKCNELIIGRDRLGEKPLYFSVDDIHSSFYFGSTIRQIMDTRSVQWKLNENRIISDLIFNFWSDKTNTHFKNIDNLPPGSVVKINTKTGVRSTHTYWQIPSMETEKSKEEILEDVRRLIYDAVDIRVRPDVEVGSILSGGIDSTLITAIAKEALPYPLKSFTLSRNDYVDEDLMHASRYCNEHNLPLKKVTIRDCDLSEEALISATRAMEEPLLDQVYLYINRNYETAHNEGLKVVLNGQGSDEVFLGYLDYYPFLREEKNYKSMSDFEDFWLTQSPLKDYINKQDVRHVIHKNIQRNFAPFQSEDTLNSVLRFGIKNHLQSLLMQEDKLSMRWSVECRTVFTDYRIVEYMSTVPSYIKMYDNREKYILRNIAKDYLPNYIVNRKKLGFPKLPDNREALVRTMMSDKLLKDSDIINRIIRPEKMMYLDKLPLYMQWKLCSIALLERSLL